MRTRGWSVGLVMVGMLVLASCSRDASTSSTGAAAPAARDVSGAADASTQAAAADQSGASGESASALGAVQQPAERKLIRNGDMALAVPAAADVERVADAATAAANDLGGRVDGDKRAGGDTPTADLVLRVPPDQLEVLVDRIGTLATVTSSAIQSDDVTNQYTDLEGRVEALQTSTVRLRGFLSEATDVDQIASIERELTQREGQLETLQGQLRVLSAKTDLATLKVAVRTEKAAPAVVASSAPAPLEALTGGWDTFRLAVGWILAAVLATLPFLVVLAVLAVGLRFWRRHRTPGTSDRPPAPAASGPG
jgi:hypothetical protein